MYKKILVLLGLLIISTSCAVPKPGAEKFEEFLDTIPTEFKDYYRIFADKIELYPMVPINFDKDLPFNIYGRCTWTINGTFIRINPVAWNFFLEKECKEELVLHELGHCVLSRNHDDSIILDNETGEERPLTVMTTYFFSCKVFKKYREKYYKRLKEKH